MPPAETFTEFDRRCMQRAITIAQRSQGDVEPNPMVGCVLARGGRIISEGRHRRFGGPHAEIDALRRCSVPVRGATCYVTLEPCCHFGKTPPCSEALIAAGVKRVVAAISDPFPRVAGGGFKQLSAAGISVATGLCRDEATDLAAPYLKMQHSGLPWVILKWAQSLDGKIATHKGDSQWISNAASRAMAHQLRGRCDAVVVGVGTVLADDPMLTCRDAKRHRIAARVVLDSQVRTPPQSNLVRSAGESPVVIMTTRSAPATRRKRLEKLGCEVVTLPANRGSSKSPPQIQLKALLQELGRRNMTNVMAEGGGAVLGAFFDQGLWDEAMIFVAPRLIGGSGATGPLHGAGFTTVAEAPALRVIESRRLDDNWMWRLRRPAGA